MRRRRPKYPVSGPWKMRRVVRLIRVYGSGVHASETYELECGHERTLCVWRRRPGDLTRCYPCGHNESKGIVQ